MKKRMRRLNMVRYAASEAEAAELKEKGFVEDPIRKAAPAAQEEPGKTGEEEAASKETAEEKTVPAEAVQATEEAAAPAEEVQTGEKKPSGKGSNRGKAKETAEKDDSND